MPVARAFTTLISNTLVLAIALAAGPALASVGQSPAPSDASAADIGPNFDWPSVEWSAETENFLQVDFRDAAAQFNEDWGQLPQDIVASGRTLKLGSQGARVRAVQHRLGLEPTALFDSVLSDRISAYRAAHGLRPSAAIDTELVNSLNLGFGYYSRKIETNLSRMRRLPAKLGERFVLVDSASQRLSLFDNQNITNTMRVVVGKPDDQTPSLIGNIDRVVLNPYWNVPPDLTQSRYADRVIRGGKNYLVTRGFEALSDWTENARILRYEEVDWRAVARGDTQLRLRQRPGPGNGMGNIKFMFNNEYGVYLHDTPSKALFSKSSRAFSAGCVRVQKPWLLAEWLFGDRPRANGAGAEQSVNLPEPVQIFLVYLTAVPNGSGFDFRDDIYSRDTTEI